MAAAAPTVVIAVDVSTAPALDTVPITRATVDEFVDCTVAVPGAALNPVRIREWPSVLRVRPPSDAAVPAAVNATLPSTTPVGRAIV